MRLSEKRSLEIVALNLLRVSPNLIELYEIPAPDSEDHRAVLIVCSALTARGGTGRFLQVDLQCKCDRKWVELKHMMHHSKTNSVYQD